MVSNFFFIVKKISLKFTPKYYHMHFYLVIIGVTKVLLAYLVCKETFRLKIKVFIVIYIYSEQTLTFSLIYFLNEKIQFRVYQYFILTFFLI